MAYDILVVDDEPGLRVPEGSVYGFLGPNGAGKSTTLKMILGLVRPTAGGITVFGKPMNGANRLTILQQVGSLIESPSYFHHHIGSTMQTLLLDEGFAIFRFYHKNLRIMFLDKCSPGF